MKRHTNFEKRNDFASQHEQIGFDYWNSPSGPEKLPYWQEGVVYGFSEKEVDKIQEATQELHDMYIIKIMKNGNVSMLTKFVDNLNDLLSIKYPIYDLIIPTIFNCKHEFTDPFNIFKSIIDDINYTNNQMKINESKQRPGLLSSSLNNSYNTVKIA